MTGFDKSGPHELGNTYW